MCALYELCNKTYAHFLSDFHSNSEKNQIDGQKHVHEHVNDLHTYRRTFGIDCSRLNPIVFSEYDSF